MVKSSYIFFYLSLVLIPIDFAVIQISKVKEFIFINIIIENIFHLHYRINKWKNSSKSSHPPNKISSKYTTRKRSIT